MGQLRLGQDAPLDGHKPRPIRHQRRRL